MRPHHLRRLAAVLLALVVTACSAERVQQPPPPGTAAYVVQVATADGAVQASYIPGPVPERLAGTAITADVPPIVIVGGSSRVTASRVEPFRQVVFNVAGYDGYYLLDLPAQVTSLETIITWAQQPPRLTFPLRTSAGNDQWSQRDVRMIRVGVGDVQVSVAFDSAADVDLYVTEPSGQEIYFAERQSATGGRLDLDANAACEIPSQPVNNENVVWGTGRAPRGTYIVRLDYFDSCGKQATNWVVTVHRRGMEPMVFSGRFTGDGSAGGAPIEITRFTF